MNKVTTKRVRELSISFEIEFMGGDLMGQSSVDTQSIIPPVSPNQVIFFITFYFSCNSLINEFKMESKIVMSFSFPNKADINKNDLFETVEESRIHLQKIINQIFSLQKPPIVSEITFSEIENKLERHIRDLRQ